MPIELRYHDKTIQIPDPPTGNIEYLAGDKISPISDIKSELAYALDNPIGSKALKEIIPDTGIISIMVSDRTRKTRLDILLPSILDYLAKNGVDDNRIRILVCLGTHKQHSDDQLKNLLGVEFQRRFEIIESHQDNPDDFIYTGKTGFGTEVRYFRHALESSLLIATGAITFHYFAGYSGGRKSFLPGLCHVSTIQANHRMTYIERDGKFDRNPACASSALDGNPVSDDMEETFRLMPVKSFLVNVVMNPEGEIAGIYTGDVIKAHRAGCEDFRNLYSLPITEKADIVIASPGGYPSDINLLQSHKSMVNAVRALKTGGTLLLAARCVEGFSLSIYPEYMKEHNREQLIEKLMQNYEILGGTTDNLMHICRNYRVFMQSGLDPKELKVLGVRPFDIDSSSWDEVYEGISSVSKCYIMPNASKFMPFVNSQVPEL